jgi:hypothetical protein
LQLGQAAELVDQFVVDFHVWGMAMGLQWQAPTVLLPRVRVSLGSSGQKLQGKISANLVTHLGVHMPGVRLGPAWLTVQIYAAFGPKIQ